MDFEYRRISKKLVYELNEKLDGGESSVLLGPRYVGKRYLLQQLKELRQTRRNHESRPVIQLKFLTEPTLTRKSDLQQAIESAVAATGLKIDAKERRTGDPFSGLTKLYEHIGKPIILLVANIDAISPHLSRAFLDDILKRILKGSLIAVLSGENDLHDLVPSAKRKFDGLDQYVIQDYEQEAFYEYLSNYTQSINVEFKSPEEAYEQLWKLTGGNIYSMRMLLWVLLELRARSEVPGDRAFEVRDIPTSPETIGIPNVSMEQVYSHATQLIARDPSSWSVLDDLLENGFVNLEVIEGNPPTTLEMAGVAVREQSPDQDVLKFASPLRERFIHQFYDHRRLGDLYASVANWKKAFACYKLLSAEERMRPSSLVDRADVDATISSLCSSLHSLMTQDSDSDPLSSIESARDLFSKGCRYGLGFREVTFWERDEAQVDRKWQRQPSNLFNIDAATDNQIAKQLANSQITSDNFLSIRDPWSEYMIAALIPSLHSNQRAAVVIGDLEKKIVISRERDRLARRLLRHFIEAYSYGVDTYKLLRRLRVRDTHVQIMNSVFNLPENNSRDVKAILTTVATGLRGLGYRRVMFSMVDRERLRIKGIIDDSDDLSINIAQETDWPLEQYEADIQPHVIHYRVSVCVPDAKAHSLVNPNLVKAARITSLAVIPILSRESEAIGTIHIEREDGAVPTPDEADDLKAFGRLLATVIERTEPYLLFSALNKIPEPIIVVDRGEHPLFVNSPAADLFGLEPGWQKPNQPVLGTAPGAAGPCLLLDESFSTGHRRVSHFEGIGKRSSNYRVGVLTDVVEDWRGDTAGGMLRVQDLDYFRRVFEASQQVAEATDMLPALEGMLRAASETLRHKWGRMYLYDKDGGVERLISRLCHPSDWYYAKEFNRGELVLFRESGPRHIDWRCIDEKTPLVFCWKEELEDGEDHITRYGLKVTNVIAPQQPWQIQKHPGDFWIDFPLMTPEGILGKMCLGCDEDLQPENFELLRLLSQEAVGLFDAFMKRARNADLAKRSAEEETRSQLLHNLFTRFGAFSPILEQYRDLENESVSLANLNRRFANTLKDALSIANRAKEKQGAIVLRPTEVDLVELLEDILSPLPANVWTFECDSRPIEASVDREHFGTAILEIVQNSREMISDPERLHISVMVESIQPDDQFEDWIKITYRDNGPGVPDAYRERIFDEFFTYRPGGKRGTGIGLYYVRRVMRAHGGFILLGLPPQGAEFTIAIPKKPTIQPEKEKEDVSYSYR